MRLYDIAMIGHISKDIIISKAGLERSLGGAVVYSSVSARRSGASVLVVTKASPVDEMLLDPLRNEGIDVVVLDSEKTTSIKNIYETENMERRKVTLLSQASAFCLEDLEGVNTKIFHLAGLFCGEIPTDFIKPLAERAEIALDAQGVLRYSEREELVFRDWENKEELLPKIAFLKTDAAEAEILTGESDRENAAITLHRMGAREVMVTYNTEMILYDGIRTYRAPFTSKNLSGRTGRGDTCFAAYLAQRLSSGPEKAGQYAAALTSIKMESPGPFQGSIQDVYQRIKEPCCSS